LIEIKENLGDRRCPTFANNAQPHPDPRHGVAGQQGRFAMSLSDFCLVLGALFAFATLVLKVIEIARR
jgi:hypothetical protein